MNRISKQLLKIAREISALDEEGDGSGFQVFHDMDNYDIKTNYEVEEGEYKNFTGNIRWNGTQGTVKNATFLLSNKHQIVFKNGTWEKGIWKNGTWQNGTWKNGQWLGGTWQNGTFISGYDKNDDYHEGRHGENPNNWTEREF